MSWRPRAASAGAVAPDSAPLSLPCVALPPSRPPPAAPLPRVLALPSTRLPRPVGRWLRRPDVAAWRAAPARHPWSGRRHSACLLTAGPTGGRVSERTGRKGQERSFSAGAHVRVSGTGRKARGLPRANSTRDVWHLWVQAPPRGHAEGRCPSASGQRRRGHGVQSLLHPQR
jgi:integrase/recombinase XerD